MKNFNEILKSTGEVVFGNPVYECKLEPTDPQRGILFPDLMLCSIINMSGRINLLQFPELTRLDNTTRRVVLVTAIIQHEYPEYSLATCVAKACALENVDLEASKDAIRKLSKDVKRCLNGGGNK